VVAVDAQGEGLRGLLLGAGLVALSAPVGGYRPVCGTL